MKINLNKRVKNVFLSENFILCREPMKRGS